MKNKNHNEFFFVFLAFFDEQFSFQGGNFHVSSELIFMLFGILRTMGMGVDRVLIQNRTFNVLRQYRTQDDLIGEVG